MKKHLIAGAVALAACGGGASVVAAQDAPAPKLPELEFDLTKKAVTQDGAQPIGAGFHRITIENKVKGQAGIGLVQLKPGVTAEQLNAALPKIRDFNVIEKYGKLVASTFFMGPSKYTTTIRLEDADYAFVDMGDKLAGRLSFHAGPAPADGGVPLPPEDATVKMLDYRFVTPATLPAGKAVIRTINSGEQQHHALVMPLKKGVNEKKVLRQVRSGQEPRDAVSGPPSALVETVSSKTTNDVEVNLRKGKYLFVCFLQDTPKSKPHAMLGMEKIVTVR